MSLPKPGESFLAVSIEPVKKGQRLIAAGSGVVRVTESDAAPFEADEDAQAEQPFRAVYRRPPWEY